jgi:uncharacterized membrane protein YqjE
VFVSGPFLGEMGDSMEMSKENGTPETASKAMARDVGEFADDVLTLAELQAQLFVADIEEFGARAQIPGVVLFSGVALGFACFPIALAGLALVLVEVYETSYADGLLIAAGGGAVMSVLLCVIGWCQVRRRLAVLQRSRQELVRNLSWVKKVLQRKRITRTNDFDNSWRTVR